jgi:hypothetical protein
MRWHLSPTHLGQAYDIGSDDGANIALVYGPKDGGPPDFLLVARLIVAVPDMLETLKTAERMIAREWPHGQALIDIRAAIAKAEGRS